MYLDGADLPAVPLTHSLLAPICNRGHLPSHRWRRFAIGAIETYKLWYVLQILSSPE
jgi:hypothetical protein